MVSHKVILLCWEKGGDSGNDIGQRKKKSTLRKDRKQFTGADDASVLPVPTVVGKPVGMGALPQVGLGPRTLHIVQKNGARALAKVGPSRGGDGRPAAQLPAHHLGFLLIPQVIAHRAPHAFEIHLHSARAPSRTFHELHNKPVFGRKAVPAPT